MTSQQRYTTRQQPRWGLLALLSGMHVLAMLGLAQVFAPDLTNQVMDQAVSLVTVSIDPPPPPQPPPRESQLAPNRLPDPALQPDEGTAGEVGRKAIASPVVLPIPPIALPSYVPMPRSPGTGAATSSGALKTGVGTGAGGAGAGSGSGRSGTGRGGAGFTGPIKIAGDIDNARDFPIPEGGRSVRLGHSVTVYMTVTVDGRARDCRVVEPSPDPVADRITCQLAEQRFRFTPAQNAAGQPVAATYGWRQAWFRK